MNLPNRLTLFRMLLIPVMVVLYLLSAAFSAHILWILGVIFLVASLTDYFDGAIARKRNIVTTFGKFMDPLADKLLVISSLLILSDIGQTLPHIWMPFWFIIIIIARELIVTSIRLVAVGGGKIIAASALGKYKTATTMVAILWYCFLMPLNPLWIHIIGWVLMGASLGLTIISGLDYFLKNRKLICESI